jgi:hypothetical protein
MGDSQNIWVVYLTTGMALSVVGLLLLDTAPWYLQYGALGLGLLFSAIALFQELPTESQA